MRHAAICLLGMAIGNACYAQDRYGASGLGPPPLGEAPPADRAIGSAFDDPPPYRTTPPAVNSGPPAPNSGRPAPISGGAISPIQPAPPANSLAQPPRQSAPPLDSFSSGERPTTPQYTTQPPSPQPATQASSSRPYDPSELMGGMLRPPAGPPRLTGDPLQMDEVVAAGKTRREQTQLVYAYWDLCSAVADYYLGLAEATELNRQMQQGGRNDAVYATAASRWQTRNATSLLAAVAAQRRLADLMGTSTLRMPGDRPLCAAYDTMYERVFDNRSSAEARDLNQLIGLRYEELTTVAAEVGSAEQFLVQVAGSRSANSEETVKALQFLAFQRRAFVQIAKDYNRQITRYTELSRPGELSTGRLVAMLVERPRTASRAGSTMPPTRSQPFVSPNATR